MLRFLEQSNSGLRGLVTSMAGEPVPGATVGVVREDTGDWAGKNVTTSGRGEYWCAYYKHWVNKYL